MTAVFPERWRFSAILSGPLIILWLGLAACAQAPPATPATATSRSALTSYQSPTPSPSPPATNPRNTAEATPPPPSPTPLRYTVVKGDTMLGIALRYGISLEDLLAANPEVDPRFLSVDTALVIPLGEENLSLLATPTPVPVGLSEPACYLTLDRGAWCFLLIENKLDEPLENVSARVYLDYESGHEVIEKSAFTPLNVIPPGSVLPAVVFFDPPLEDEFVAGAELVSALPASGVGERYIPANIKIHRERVAQTRSSAEIEGIISTPRRSGPAGLIRLIAVAYGADGRVVGVRQAEIQGPAGAGEDIPFSLEVFSLGPPIEVVEAFVEAVPISGGDEATPTGN